MLYDTKEIEDHASFLETCCTLLYHLFTLQSELCRCNDLTSASLLYKSQIKSESLSAETLNSVVFFPGWWGNDGSWLQYERSPCVYIEGNIVVPISSHNQWKGRIQIKNIVNYILILGGKASIWNGSLDCKERKLQKLVVRKLNLWG